jgi:transcription antitermination factor NusG
VNLRDKPWPWFAILARGGRERNAKAHLEGAGYQCYVPLRRCTRRWSDRTKEIQLPLFPGYLFCRMDPHNRLPILMTPGVIHIVGVGKTPIPVDENEMASIQRLERSSLAITPWPYPEMGGVARIEEGPLKGLTGIVVRIKSGLKLVLSVSLLQRAVAVEIDRRWIAATIPTRSAVDAFSE